MRSRSLMRGSFPVLAVPAPWLRRGGCDVVWQHPCRARMGGGARAEVIARLGPTRESGAEPKPSGDLAGLVDGVKIEMEFVLPGRRVGHDLEGEIGPTVGIIQANPVGIACA